MKVPSPRPPALRAVLAAVLVAGAMPPLANAQGGEVVDEVARLYAGRGDAPVWTAGSVPSSAAQQALAQLLRAAEHGLVPGDYDALTLDSLSQRLVRGPPDGHLAAQFDRRLSVAFIRFLADLRDGRAPHAALGATRAGAAPDLAVALSEAVAGDSVPRLVAGVEPGLMQYHVLRIELARYRALAADTTLPAVPVVARVRPGDAYEGAPALARRLAALGDLPAEYAPPAEPRYAGDLVEGVRRFQRRHGLAPDGVIGRNTFAALSAPLAGRVRQIELALERLRWLPPLRGQRAIAVNIPSFRLFAFDSVGGATGPALQMRVIVGKALDTRTPVLAEQLRYLEFQPYWNVPRSIMIGEILPQLHRRPGYLRAHAMELVGPRGRVEGDSVTPSVLQRLTAGELRLRQRPGPQNPLGRVKFVFPNAADVYLHGTSDTTLFGRERRDFSHGCIRLERPGDLAAWALSEQPGWGRDSVDAALAARRTRRVPLARPVPVILFYATAVAIPGLGVAFLGDIYGHDRALDQTLRAGRTPP
jgi:murein L,D-transpeptidase YcbB/YkuD